MLTGLIFFIYLNTGMMYFWRNSILFDVICLFMFLYLNIMYLKEEEIIYFVLSLLFLLGAWLL